MKRRRRGVCGKRRAAGVECVKKRVVEEEEIGPAQVHGFDANALTEENNALFSSKGSFPLCCPVSISYVAAIRVGGEDG